jgi:hypothetical protein
VEIQIRTPPKLRLTGLALSNPVILRLFVHAIPTPFSEECLPMKDVYAVLRQKELEKSRLENEVEALRVVAPILSEDGETENANKPTLTRRGK